MLNYSLKPDRIQLHEKLAVSRSMIHKPFVSFCQRSLKVRNFKETALKRSAAELDFIRHFRQAAFRTMAQAATLDTQTQGLEASACLSQACKAHTISHGLLKSNDATSFADTAVDAQFCRQASWGQADEEFPETGKLKLMTTVRSFICNRRQRMPQVVYLQVNDAFYSLVAPTPTETEPYLVASSSEMANEIGLGLDSFNSTEFAKVFSGNSVLPAFEG